jgi:hypothetical protein
LITLDSPPVAEVRLERTESGDILYKLKTPFRDGTIGIQLSPSELIEKRIAQIPPRSNPLVLYGGVFAPNFKRLDRPRETNRMKRCTGAFVFCLHPSF